jgi:hypothetical protein
MNCQILPKHSIGEAIDDCYDGHWWSRGQGYRPHQIVLAGDPPEATCHSPWPNGCSTMEKNPRPLSACHR